MKKDKKLLDMVGIVNNKKLLQIFTSEANAYKILNKQKLKLIDYLAESSDKLVMPNLIDKDFTMTPNKTYLLQGLCRVVSGATLTIPEGVDIEIIYLNDTINTETYILVENGAKINVNGTKANPVVMYSNMNKNEMWGGLVIVGSSKVLNNVGKQIKNKDSLIGDVIYGGDNEEDDSGSISNLIIKDAGSFSEEENRFAGLTLYSVGSKTKIDNVAVVNCRGNGVNIYGGSVTIKNFYASKIVENSISWNEGWNGTLSGVYVENNILNFYNSIQADGYDNRPILENVTLYSNKNGNAFKFNYYSGAYINGLKIVGFEKNFFREQDDDNNIRIEGATPDRILGNPAVLIDLQLANTSSLLKYKGRFLLPNNPDEDLTLYSNMKYGMISYCNIKAGITLNIMNNVSVMIMYYDEKQASETYLLLELGSKIFVSGTSDKPVHFYSSTGKPGSWRGIIMLGNAYVYDMDGVPLLNQSIGIENFKYGGIIDEHNGGRIDYLKLEHAGAKVNNEISSGFSLYGVGRNTILLNITVANCLGGGVILYGGCADMTYLFVKEVGNVSLEYSNGWSGVMDGTFILNSYADFEAAICSKGIDKRPHFHDIYCISIVGGVCFKFKDNSGGNINNITRIGYKIDQEFLGDNKPIISGINLANLDTTVFNWSSLI